MGEAALLAWLVLVLIVALVIRFFTLWYFRINEIVTLQEEQRDIARYTVIVLEQIRDRLPEPPQEVNTG